MKQQLALAIMQSGESVFLTGAAGSGKTYTLQQFIRLAKSDGKKVSVTATTGIAATHLGGTTIHSWAGIGISDQLYPNFADAMPKGRREIIEKTDVLVIDEISMLHDYRLDMVDEVCRVVRKNPDEPFGGLQVIFSGDFFQLPPINRGTARAGRFAVHANSWKELDPVVCYLEEQHRQDDAVLEEILTALRSNDIRRSHAEMLLSRVEIQPPEDEELTELHTVNIDVDTINEKKLAELDGDEISYERVTTGAANYVETLERSVLAPPTLRLKLGALVMAVKNAPNRAYANGSIGTVIDFEPGTDYPVVKFKNGKTVSMLPESWELRDGDKKRASISQIPLRLAWAMTVHKSQGMTLDAARIDLRKAFVEGMGYVALSRVKNIENLYLHGINQMALRMGAESHQLDADFMRRSGLDAKRLAHLETSFEKKQKQIDRKPARTGWAEKIEKMRETYPNAYRPWTNQQDTELKEGFQTGKTVVELSQLLGRHEGSVTMRLQKHFGEDVVA